MIFKFFTFIFTHNNFKNYIKSLFMMVAVLVAVNVAYAVLVALGMPVHPKAQKLLFVKTALIFLCYCIFTVLVWWTVYANSRNK